MSIRSLTVLGTALPQLLAAEPGEEVEEDFDEEGPLTFEVDDTASAGSGAGSTKISDVSYSDMLNVFGDPVNDMVDPSERWTARWGFRDSQAGAYEVYDWNDRIALWENRGDRVTLNIVGTGDVFAFSAWLEEKLGKTKK